MPADHDPSRPAEGVPAFNPAEVPVSPAATVMLVDDRPDLHVLMVQRTSRVVFAPSAWVFPGGRVDPEDHRDDFDTICSGLSDTEASTILDVAQGGLAWWVAACRETLEEAGLLLAAATGATNAGHHEFSVASMRDQVRQNEARFVDLLLQHDIVLDVSAIEEVARFITPLGSPRRFDARFFLARAPEHQEPVQDDGEIVRWEWVQPADALERFQAGTFEMISPTVRMLACLARYRTADEALSAARERRPYERVRVIDPQGAYIVVLPGEPGYETAELEVESGWVRF